MKLRPCGSLAGSVRPSLRPGVSSRVNKPASGWLPSANALNWLAYWLFGLYANTICVPANWAYQLVNVGMSGVMLSPPTDSKTSGWIVPAAISDDRVPDAPPVPTNVYPLAFLNAGAITFSFRYWRDEA